ncbi:MAG: epoxyqueuosine reductase QueH [Candidatus Gracilibacteria bacterium]|nr:epoxyqueuosine reductase QueH [Candidatus Gracilibacteria bacterium]
MYKIGIDEAGRGPWLGPVVACSLTFDLNNLPDSDFLKQLNDSKKLTIKKREKIFNELVKLSNLEKPQVYFGVGIVDNFLIDEINIKQANKEAIRRSLIEILRKIDNKKISGVLIDGNDNYVFNELPKKPIYVIGGDAKILEISAASIIAKVFRDKLIDTYGLLYPSLGVESHKGYGTKKHINYLTDKTRITGIHRISYKPVKKVLEQKPKLLLHICCGPDASIPIIDLKNDYDITCFWYDPNIQPKSEYNKRLKAFKKVCEIENVEFIEGEYDVENFFSTIKGLEKTKEMGEKCKKCYDMRLKRTAIEAKKLGIKYWTTSLNISPHKDINNIFEIGDKYSLEKNLEFLKIAFRKNNGFLRSIEYCKKNNIYRQNYCGCIYSDTFHKK